MDLVNVAQIEVAPPPPQVCYTRGMQLLVSSSHQLLWLGLHTAKGEAVRYHNRYRRNDTVFYRYCYRYIEVELR